MLLAYLGDAKLKHDFLAEILRHEEQDALIKGSYGKMNGTFTGCAIGCALHSLNLLQGKVGRDSAAQTGVHARFGPELGLPTWWAYLEDYLYESLPEELSKTWLRRSHQAIPVGAVVDDVVLAKILRWSLADEVFGVRTDDVAAAWAVRAVRAAREAMAARAARAVRAAGSASEARAAWAAMAVKKADAFLPALSEFVIRTVSQLEPVSHR